MLPGSHTLIATLRVAALSGTVNIKHVWHQACLLSCHQPGITHVADTSTVPPATLQSQTKAKTSLDYSVPWCTLLEIWHGKLYISYTVYIILFIISNIKNSYSNFFHSMSRQWAKWAKQRITLIYKYTFFQLPCINVWLVEVSDPAGVKLLICLLLSMWITSWGQKSCAVGKKRALFRQRWQN